MAGTPTTRLTIPIPAGGDTVAVPADIRAAAERIDAIGVAFDQGPLSTIRAGGALEAQAKWKGWRFYASDVGAWFWCDGTIWVLETSSVLEIDAPAPLGAGRFVGDRVRYRPAAVDVPWLAWSMRWDGTRWIADGQQPAHRGSQSNTFVQLTLGNAFQTMSGGKYTVPFAGDWEFEVSAYVDLRAEAGTSRAVYVLPATAGTNYLAVGEVPLAGFVGPSLYDGTTIAGALRLTSVPVSTTVGVILTAPGGATVGVNDRRISARPLRVSPTA